MLYSIHCSKCRKEISSRDYPYLCPHCEGILEVEYDLKNIGKQLPPQPSLKTGMKTYEDRTF